MFTKFILRCWSTSRKVCYKQFLKFNLTFDSTKECPTKIINHPEGHTYHFQCFEIEACSAIFFFLLTLQNFKSIHCLEKSRTDNLGSGLDPDVSFINLIDFIRRFGKNIAIEKYFLIEEFYLKLPQDFSSFTSIKCSELKLNLSSKSLLIFMQIKIINESLKKSLKKFQLWFFPPSRLS